MNTLSGDRPLTEGDLDRLGFAPLADRVAKALVSQTSPAGMVVGLEGAWGSGKSSLLFLTLKALRADKVARPAVLEFRPWLIGDRDALLLTLFNELAKTISQIKLDNGDATDVTNAFLKKTAKTVRQFAAHLETPGKLVQFASMIPGAAAAGGALEAVAKAAKAAEAAPSLSKMKDDLNRSLAKLPCRIIVAIDDVDRLEPNEAVELLRLVRSVADFPNVVYLLCYDEPVLSQSVKTAAKVSDGRAYLEKIIQVSIAVPTPEPFDLRRWFAQQLRTFAIAELPEDQSRVEAVIDAEGAWRLTTPRAVVRTLNSLSFVWPALHQSVDLADLVWLHLIKTQNPGFYRWIEDYCAGAAVNASWRVSINDDERRRATRELEAIFKAEGRSLEGLSLYQMLEHVPGVGHEFDGGVMTLKLYTHTDRHTLAKDVEGRRLASPDHYRLYFALAQPQHAPRQADFDAFWTACSKSSLAISALITEWVRTSGGVNATKADTMLERLAAQAERAIDNPTALKIVQAFAHGLDEPLHLASPDPFGGPAVWSAAERLMPVLAHKARLADPDGLVETFRSGQSLSWLINVLRDEMGARGMFPEGSRRPDQRIMTDEEFDAAHAAVRARFEEMSFRQIQAHPRPWAILYTWAALDAPAAKAIIAKTVRSARGLLDVLDMLSGSVRSGSAVYGTLKTRRLDPFLDGAAARKRVETLAQKPGEIGVAAQRILDMFHAGDNF
ncbi:KAP family P-loop NTPase fold protein [Caulobacter segnis]